MSRTVICNKCGKKLNASDIEENFSMYKIMGYGTKYDGEVLEMDFCCDCMEKLIDWCDVCPIKS